MSQENKMMGACGHGIIDQYKQHRNQSDSQEYRRTHKSNWLTTPRSEPVQYSQEV